MNKRKHKRSTKAVKVISCRTPCNHNTIPTKDLHALLTIAQTYEDMGGHERARMYDMNPVQFRFLQAAYNKSIVKPTIFSDMTEEEIAKLCSNHNDD